MKNKKIIIFMPTIELGGGVEKNFLIISNYLSTKFDNLTVISLSKKYRKYLNNNINFKSLSHKFLDNIGRRKKFFLALFLLLKIIIKNKNVSVFSFQGHAYCILLCKLFGVKVIVRSNSSPSGWSKNFIKLYLYKKIYSLADIVIVNSLEFKKEFKEKFKINVECIYNPLNIKEVIKLSKKKIKFNFFDKKSLNIINVARLNEQKDQLLLIKVINKLKNKIPLKLLLIGNGDEKEKILNYINENNLSKITKILSFKRNPFPFIIKSDLFILSSKYEGLPNILIETMSLKKPVISSDCPTGPREILDRGLGGTLFKNQNQKDLYNKIIMFNKNKINFIKKVKFGYKRLDRFDYKKNLNVYFKLINKTIN